LLDGDHLGDHQDSVDERTLFWLVALTPAPVKNPADPAPRLDAFPDVRFVCKATIADRPVAIGGFDMARGAPLDNRAMLPAGSSWLFRLEGGGSADRAAALRALNCGFLLGHRQEAAFGYGQTLVGLHPSDN